jgi:hypothetical protein
MVYVISWRRSSRVQSQAQEYVFRASFQSDAVAVWTRFQNLGQYIDLIRYTPGANSQIQQCNCFDNKLKGLRWRINVCYGSKTPGLFPVCCRH